MSACASTFSLVYSNRSFAGRSSPPPKRPSPAPSRPISRASSRVTRSQTAAAAPEPSPMQVERELVEISPSPPPWEDTSEVLFQKKSIFAISANEPPAFTEAKSLSEALRSVVRARLMFDRQPRDEIVNPVLMANHSTAASLIMPKLTQEGFDSTPEGLVEEVTAARRMEDFQEVRPSLVEHFEQRQASIKSKVDRLSKEYLRLHDKWRAHCSALSDHQRASLSTDHEALLHTGRATRRTTAITDAVRSDLEMEQIIASLESNDAMDPNYLSMRNAATIPDMISVTHGKVDYLFDDTNHLVEDPAEYYAPDTGIDDWTDEEKRIFIDKFAQYPKQFGIIAEYIPHKTSSQCVAYYYLHKKRQIDFRKVIAQLGPKKRKRRGGGKKKGNALLTDIAQHDAEVGKEHTFVVPSRTGKGKRGAGRPPKVSSATAAGGDRGAATGETPAATPQPEPRSARLAAQAAAALLGASVPNTPEPEGRPKRSTRRREAANKDKDKQKESTSASAGPPVSQSASTSGAGSKPVSSASALYYPPVPGTPMSISMSEPLTPAPSTPAQPSAMVLEPAPPPPVISVPMASRAPWTFSAETFHPMTSQTSTSGLDSVSSGMNLRFEEDDYMAVSLRVLLSSLLFLYLRSISRHLILTTRVMGVFTLQDLNGEPRPKRAPKRGRKQVKSVAIIHEEPPSPPPESASETPNGEASDRPEPSMMLTQATKILSEFDARQQKSRSSTRNGSGKSTRSGKEKSMLSLSSSSSSKAHDAKTGEGVEKDFPEAEKSRWT